MCAGVWADQGRSREGGMASSSGIPDSFPSDPQEYYANSLPKKKHPEVYIIKKTVKFSGHKF